LEVSGPHFIFGKIKVYVSQSRPAGTRKTLGASVADDPTTIDSQKTKRKK
jgi:hypothetical protein